MNLSNFMENVFIDVFFRGQTATINGKSLSWSAAPTLYVALYTSNPTDAGGGTEVSGGSYARAAIASSLANWAGTQGSGTTVASNGATGQTSNNVAIQFPTPTADWGTITGFGVHDAASGGNLIVWGAFTGTKLVKAGDAAPAINATQLTIELA